MKRYRFTDSDPTGHEDYDIGGDDYIALLRTCISYCKYLSFCIRDNSIIVPSRMMQHRINTTVEIAEVYRHNGVDVGCVLTFAVYPELLEDMLSISNTVFGWIDGWNFKHPEDFAFFREDGTVFFYSVIHEGYCYLEPRDDEDVNRIVQDHRWVQKN